DRRSRKSTHAAPFVAETIVRVLTGRQARPSTPGDRYPYRGLDTVFHDSIRGFARKSPGIQPGCRCRAPSPGLRVLGVRAPWTGPSFRRAIPHPSAFFFSFFFFVTYEFLCSAPPR